MANRTAEYWKERFEQIEQSQNKVGLSCYENIEKQYRQAQKEIEGQLASWYQRFADNNQISLVDAQRVLTKNELKEFRWDVNQYIRYGQENAVNGAWTRQLENASVKYHVSRLEALKIQTQQSLEVMFGNQLDSIDSTMRDVYKSGYYHTAYEVQKGVGVAWNFATLDDRQINKVINKPWAVDGKNFSERIWGNKQKLISELNQTLTQNIILGKDPQKAIDEIARKMNVSKSVAGRLVMTEEAYFNSAAQKDCLKELDVEEYEIVATLDSHTSEICQAMDGKHFKMSEWEVGATAPPFHVYCRSTTVPYFGDEFDSVGERAARDEETGKTYYVPENMTYKDWKKAMVDGDKSGLKEIKPDDTMKQKEHTASYNALKTNAEDNKIKFNKVETLETPLTDSQIIERLAGGDMTKGSCASLAFSYIGNKNGLDVLDFRGGSSQKMFSKKPIIRQFLGMDGVKGNIIKVQKEAAGTAEIIESLEQGKEYCLVTGKHAAIVRKTESGAEYLELQSRLWNGWTSFDKYGSTVDTLIERFGCKETADKAKLADGQSTVIERKVVIMEVDSFKDNDEFQEILGYINTASGKQKKGVSGGVK